MKNTIEELIFDVLEEPALFFLQQNLPHLRNAFKNNFRNCKKIQECFNDAVNDLLMDWQKKTPEKWESLTKEERFSYTLRALINKGIKIFNECVGCDVKILSTENKEFSQQENEVISSYLRRNTFRSPYDDTRFSELIEFIFSNSSPEEAQIVILSEIYGYSSAEIADYLKDKPENIRQKKGRTLNRLRDLFG